MRLKNEKTQDYRIRAVVVPPQHLGWLEERARPKGGDASAYVCVFAYEAGARHIAKEKCKQLPKIKRELHLSWHPWRQLRADVGKPAEALDVLRDFQLAALYAVAKDAFDVLPFSACKRHARSTEFWIKACAFVQASPTHPLTCQLPRS